MPIFDHFGLLAPFYDRIFSPGEREKLIEKIDLPTDGVLLDAGGGTGRISQFLREYSKRIVIADLSFEMLLQAKAKNGLYTVCCHTEQLPFLNKVFDRIIMIDALHHVCDQVETAKELVRVLKPGGKIIIEEPDINRIGVKALALGEKILGMRSHFFSPTEIAGLFDGFNVEIVSEGAIAWVTIET